MKTIVKEFPTIGREIEDFVKSCNVGADAWRRTGVLTFDGNIRVKSKATFGRIRDHLIKTFGRNFAYGTVVELCVARNKRRNLLNVIKAWPKSLVDVHERGSCSSLIPTLIGVQPFMLV